MLNIKKRDIWTDREVQHMLAIIKENHILKLLDSKTKRNKNIFEDVAVEMAAKGIEKNAVQIRTKFKSLKLDYFKIKRNNNKSGAKRQTNEHFELLDEILSRRPAVSAEGIDTSLVEVCTASNEETSYEWYTEEVPNAPELSPDAQSPKAAKRTFQRTKKQSFQKAVETFSKEWKQSQSELMEYMKCQDEHFLGKQEEILQKNREETAKILEKDREETMKMMSSFLESMRPPHPVVPNYLQPTQTNNSQLLFSPGFVTSPENKPKNI